MYINNAIDQLIDPRSSLYAFDCARVIGRAAGLSEWEIENNRNRLMVLGSQEYVFKVALRIQERLSIFTSSGVISRDPEMEGIDELIDTLRYKTKRFCESCVLPVCPPVKSY